MEKANYCQFKHKECPKPIKHHGTEDGGVVEESTWEALNRLCVRGSLPKIDTRETGFGDYVFKQNSPKTAAEILSSAQVLGFINIHSCQACAETIAKSMKILNLLEDESK